MTAAIYLVVFKFFMFNLFYFVSSHISSPKKILLVSLDGFRWDFRNKTSTPNLDWIVKNGVSVDYVLNVFPTDTFPNHHTVVTGLYPEHHGVIANQLFDRQTEEVFSPESNPSKWWQQATPIWIENQIQGHESGVCFWPGYDKVFNRTKAKYTPSNRYGYPFADCDNIMPISDRLELVINWLRKSNVTFAALYIDNIDVAAHRVGADSLRGDVNLAIRSTDRMIGRLRKKFRDYNLSDSVDTLLIGDHGSLDMSNSKVALLDGYVNFTCADDISGRTSVFVYAKTKCKNKIYSKLRSVENHFNIYLKEEIPENFHIKHNNRTADILLLAHPGWALVTDKTSKDYRSRRKEKWEIGEHGYSNMVKDMNPGFLGFGPSFRSSYKQEMFESVDLYSLMCHILQIKPKRNDGNFDRVKTFLKEYSH